jgi:hypothetical protein
MTMSAPDPTDLAWQKLRQGDSVGEFPVSTVRLDLDAGHGSIRLGLGRDGSPQLLVPTGSGRRIPDGLSGASVSVRAVQYVVDGKPQNFIEVRSAERHLDEVFRRLVDEVLRRLTSGSSPELAIADAISDLRDLLRKQRSLGIEFLVGLFGELSILEMLLRQNPDAARCWTGPIPQRYDFSALGVCAEVKASLRHGAAAVHISSLAQLTLPADGRPLYLFYFTLERTGAGGRSIQEMIESARALASDPDSIEASMKALDLEDWRQLPALASESFGVIEVCAYRVEDGFPRLTRSSFVDGDTPAGVSKIQYEIDLSHAKGFRLDESSMREALRELSRTS